MRLSKKALEDFKNSEVYKNIKKVCGKKVVVGEIIYHKWLNEKVECPHCDGQGIIYYHIDPSEKKRDCMTCEGKGIITRVELYL